ncbi:hypothetical protein [Bacillus sp. OTU530]|uniref:hypothetical protein n=1 Tax=Bacillus sp. OTU530 TaxID=3043862 RepID=UPI00313C5208
MSLEWFYRMEHAVRQSLPGVCEGFDELNIVFDTDTTTKHPSFIFSVAVGFDEGEQESFCLIHFDPVNQEFYCYHSEEDTAFETKALFGNLDEMLAFIHDAFHEYLDEMEDADFDEEDEEFGDYDDDPEKFDDYDDDPEEFDDYDDDFEEDVEENDSIEWITNDKYAHIEEHSPNGDIEYNIHYKLGIVPETGDGVLLRNTVTKENGEESEEGIMIFFKEEEAPYIKDLIGEYLAREIPYR